MNKLQSTTTQFSLYDLYTEHKEITDHSKLVTKFNTAVKNLTEVSKSLISWEVAKRASTTKQGITKEVSTIIMDKRTALWFSSKLNDELRLALIMKVEKMDRPQQSEPQPLSFNQMKIQALTKISDQINALEDDTKKVEQLPQIQKEPEVIAVIEALPQIRQDKATKKTIKRMTNHKYYHMPVTNIIDIPLNGPKTGVVHFDFYTATKVIWTDKNGVTRKLAMPSWAKSLDFSYIEAEVTYRESEKKAFFDLVRIVRIG